MQPCKKTNTLTLVQVGKQVILLSFYACALIFHSCYLISCLGPKEAVLQLCSEPGSRNYSHKN